MKDQTAGQAAPLEAYSPTSTLYALIFDEAVNLHRAGQVEKAEPLYRAVLALYPTHAEASYNLGVIYHAQRRLPEAVIAYRDAIFFRSDYVDAYSNLGTVLKEQGKRKEALIFYQQALRFMPQHVLSLSNLGVLLNDMGRTEDAVAAFHQALALSPDYEWAYLNLSPALLERGDREGSIEACRRAIVLKPDMPIAHYNLGASLKTVNRIDETIVAFREAIHHNPDFVEAHFGLGQMLLMQGKYEAGWPEYEWRWKQQDYQWLRNIHGEFSQPRWTGERLNGKTILIYSEQGMGDAIQYVRYIPRVIAKGGKVVLAVHPPLKPLFAAIDGVTITGLDDVPFPPFDVYCPLLSLPLVFKTRFTTIPTEVPYLFADPAATDRWRARVGGTGLRVGIVWAGNPTQKGDHWRSPRLASVQPLFTVPGVDFVALQMGPGRDDIRACPLPSNVLDLGEEIKDFRDTAAIMAGLDLVITSCTAPLHLACALGVPTWGMIPFAPHFLWQLDRSDSPWYPTLRLYRQDTPGGDWSGAVGRIAADLAALAKR